jgi:hypothetical protein
VLFDPRTFLAPGPNAGLARGATGSIKRFNFRNARYTNDVPMCNPRVRGAKKVGLSYERRVLDVLSAIYGYSFRPSPVIRYEIGAKRRAAIPDGILRFGDTVVVIEVKLAHTERVWEQLMERYAPLVRTLERGATVRTVEVCRYYDPAVICGPHTLIHSLHRPGTGLEVLQWRI